MAALPALPAMCSRLRHLLAVEVSSARNAPSSDRLFRCCRRKGTSVLVLERAAAARGRANDVILAAAEHGHAGSGWPGEGRCKRGLVEALCSPAWVQSGMGRPQRGASSASRPCKVPPCKLTKRVTHSLLASEVRSCSK
eukprot:364664-Chlamydomonas_euryale.AAC.5